MTAAPATGQLSLPDFLRGEAERHGDRNDLLSLWLVEAANAAEFRMDQAKQTTAAPAAMRRGRRPQA